ncbi:carbon storage regulator CsrA [Pseudomonas gingeri]|uniref:Translational regulator CsrA n=1 Tax=Pseudomonas gingeri TaxID=117681 RepID=A0A7Y7X8S1_9PSED|nr:carbon storage regulator CsrA [Pseudomonas gingeri]NWA26216.1 carbon storage regulator CsrA [Pseudomonas gingeri]NWB95125.1 carbon storage regulator CsrA [Pseudomonas gingeri]NWD67730.1 carbon storage regulator CsrA [Pseudomonas gingeri]NWD75285.1 carbon storage regulator CsrA [Pseudomonas gingeri]
MLVLSRVVGEMISIGDNITVRILAINGNHVRFGVEAPKNVNVHRAEIYRRILTQLSDPEPVRDSVV